MAAEDTSREALIEQVENLLMDERDKYPRVHNDAPSADLAEAVVDAVVMPLVEGRVEAVRARNYAMRQRDEERTAKEGNIRALNAAIKRAEAAEAAHKALTEGVQELADAWEDDARPVAGRIVFGLRAILDEHGATR